jgi:hypothetical protein
MENESEDEFNVQEMIWMDEERIRSLRINRSHLSLTGLQETITQLLSPTTLANQIRLANWNAKRYYHLIKDLK